MQQGLALASRSTSGCLESLGVDTWGVDFGLLDARGELLGNPYHYRDARTEGMLDAAFARVPRPEIYRQTGNQFMAFNTLYQLLALAQAGSPQLAAAQRLLNTPDLFNYWLSGVQASELTIATTSQCYDPRAGSWAWALLEQLGLPARIFGEIAPPGTVLGPLRPGLAETVGCGPVQVVATASHDTAAAVAAVPASEPDSIYISSGTWSLMGVESRLPLISEASLDFNLTNEGSAAGFYVHKIIMGLWLLQECRREWEAEGYAYSYDDLTVLAADSPALRAWVAPSDPRFLPPSGPGERRMSARIRAFCLETGQPAPEPHGEVARCILESLALEYRRTADKLAALLERELPVIHIIGGGSRNRLLNQFTANATGRRVVSGPVEATAIGNILVQAVATGHLASLEEGRQLLRRSIQAEYFEPADLDAWEAAYQKYLRIVV
ncbi:MAG TPA: rhamnulokinase family protein [Anaerolineales bacterium]